MSISSDVQNNLRVYFEKCVQGYHLINDDPIKEAPWEDINAQILTAAGCAVQTQSKGSHRPGADIVCSLGDFSNKSTQYNSDRSGFQISSYRLTTVCSDRTPGNVRDIIQEINKRKNFQFYSIIVRDETVTDVTYDWFLIPADYPILDPGSYVWSPKMGKRGKNAGAITGWETNVMNGSSMSITFSMSSQLWLDVYITEDMKQYIMGSITLSKGRKYNYIQMHSMFAQN